MYNPKGHVPVLPLNYTILSNEGSYDRDSIQLCVKEILLTMSRCLFTQKGVHLDFCEVGRVIVKDSRIHMKFFRSFIKQLDINGELENVFKLHSPQSDLSIMTTPVSTRSCSSDHILLPRYLNSPSPKGQPTMVSVFGHIILGTGNVLIYHLVRNRV